VSAQVLVYRPESRLTALDCLAHPFFRSVRLGPHDPPDAPLDAGPDTFPAALRLFDYTREEVRPRSLMRASVYSLISVCSLMRECVCSLIRMRVLPYTRMRVLTMCGRATVCMLASMYVRMRTFFACFQTYADAQ
jgi:hypothetical protein